MSGNTTACVFRTEIKETAFFSYQNPIFFKHVNNRTFLKCCPFFSILLRQFSTCAYRSEKKFWSQKWTENPFLYILVKIWKKKIFRFFIFFGSTFFKKKKKIIRKISENNVFFGYPKVEDRPRGSPAISSPPVNAEVC